jgi:CO/xanthine dehydrogenase FAD-binding subunit
MLRRLQNFAYFKPSTVGEALDLLEEHDGRIMAGGTDLLVGMKEQGSAPSSVIDIKGIAGLDRIEYVSGSGMSIGTLCTMNEIAASADVRNHYPILASAAGKVGSVQVRNRATIGGNLSNAAPCAETAGPLICLDARLKLVSKEGEREIPVEEFFQGPGMTALKSEMITVVLIPPSADRGIYIKHSPRKAMDIAVLNVAVSVREAKDGGAWESVRIVFGSAAPTPVRARKAEDLLAGTPLTSELIEEAAREAMEAVTPITDVRGTARYRREMAGSLISGALRSLANLGDG